MGQALQQSQPRSEAPPRLAQYRCTCRGGADTTTASPKLLPVWGGRTSVEKIVDPV